MRSLGVTLIFSLVVGLLNTALMPLAQPMLHHQSADAHMTSFKAFGAHEPCAEATHQEKSTHHDSRLVDSNKVNESSNHFCCAFFAIPATSIFILEAIQTHQYLIAFISKPLTLFPESIFKPPKLQAS